MAHAQWVTPMRALPQRCGGLLPLRPRVAHLRRIQHSRGYHCGKLASYNRRDGQQGSDSDIPPEEAVAVAMTQAVLLASVSFHCTDFIQALKFWNENTVKPGLTKFQQENLTAEQRAAFKKTSARITEQAERAQKTMTKWHADGTLDRQASQAERLAKEAYNRMKTSFEKEVLLYVARMTAADISAYYPWPLNSPSASPLAWWVVGAALVTVLFTSLGNSIRSLWRKKPARQEGRWVRDRALGGKLVFVPDSPLPPSRSAKFADDFPKGLAKANNVQNDKDAAEAAGTAGSTLPSDSPPTWWAPPAPAKYCPKFRKTELTQQAQETIRMLDDCKMAGQDYPLYLLLRLRQICHEGAGLQVKVSTEGGRDSLLRAAIRYAMEAALRFSPVSELGGYEPGRLVSGLATDLDVPIKRAVSLTHSQVASICRSSLIDAEVAFRTKDQNRFDESLSRMILTLRAFPLPLGSPEAELVGRTIQGQTTLDFRRDVFFAVGCAAIEVAPAVAELMGFNPAQVMEQLKMQIAARKAAQPAVTSASERELNEKLAQQAAAAAARAEEEKRAQKTAAAILSMKKAEEEQKALQAEAARAEEQKKKVQQALETAAAAMRAVEELKVQQAAQAAAIEAAAAAKAKKEEEEEEIAQQAIAAAAAAATATEKAAEETKIEDSTPARDVDLTPEGKTEVEKMMTVKRAESATASVPAAARRAAEGSKQKQKPFLQQKNTKKKGKQNKEK